LEDPVNEIQEYEYLVENLEVEEGKVDNNNEEEVIDLIAMKIMTYTAPELKDVCRALSLSTSGNKDEIFARIWDSLNPLIEQIDDKPFMYKKKGGRGSQLIPPTVGCSKSRSCSQD
jgi:hypothetical protein